MATILYSGWNSSASWRVRAALTFKGIEYTTYLALNPSGLVPTLFHNGYYLNQSPAILEYLEEVYPSNPLLPSATDPVARARVRALAAIIYCDTHPLQNKSVLEKVSELRRKTGRDEEFAQWIIAKGFAAYETMLEKTMGTFSYGEQFTIADYLRYVVDMTAFPKIQQVMSRVNEIPCIKLTHPSTQDGVE
ncbi:thioredoxin-like protein [Obelidium mucronatum]|nr:thioredoxin-like protein [Obelidium mucronatum]